MFFDQLMNQGAQPALGSMLGSGSTGGLGSLASLIAMGAGGQGQGMAPQMPQPGGVPQSGPTATPIPSMPQQPQQGGLLQMLMGMDPEKLRAAMMSMGIGMGGGGGNMMNGSPGLINNLLASRDFSSMGEGGGRY